MNYLAHSVLSFNDEQLLVGNFIADHIKIRKADHLPEGIRKGITLHRKIDNFTDSHPLFIKSKRCFYEGFERYSGVLLDIYYDYVLAKNFDKYSELSLEQYISNFHVTLEKNRQHLPESSQRFLDYATQRNTFFEYSKLEGIELVLRHLSFRINHGIDLSLSLPLFVKNYEEIETDFFVFFEDLKAFAKSELSIDKSTQRDGETELHREG
jgi:acyl carrier protein phosphodiesterase